jgi:hypothetical protein
MATEPQSPAPLAVAKYATSFRRLFLGTSCDVDIVVDLVTFDTVVTIAMRSVLSGRPTFAIMLDDVRLLTNSLKVIRNSAALLESRVRDATDHQLNVSVAGAVAIVARAPGKPAHYSLSIGSFHQEGELSELDLKDLDASIDEIDVLVKETLAKVRGV